MKTRSKIRIPMPARYVINLALVVGFYFLLTGLISSGVITNYWTGILITVGINIILAVSLNIATGYLGQLPLGHAGFMATLQIRFAAEASRLLWRNNRTKTAAS